MSANTRELFRRSERNPILEAGDWPYPAHSVFNPGAAVLPGGETLLLARVEDRRGQSHLTAARSADGVANWKIDSAPTLRPDAERHPEESWGVEDPRITRLEEIGRWAVAYTAYSAAGPGVSLALTEDFRSFERKGLVLPPENKDAALFPRRFGGRWAMIHRPVTGGFGAHIWLCFSPDLEHWGEHALLLRARGAGWWDSGRIGLSPQPIETSAGGRIGSPGARGTTHGFIYRMGLVLLDLDDPRRVIRRGEEWVFGPEELEERTGDVGNVAFSCGATMSSDGKTLNLYYGAADTRICLATAKLADLLEFLRRSPPV